MPTRWPRCAPMPRWRRGSRPASCEPPAAAHRHGRLALRQPHGRAALSPARHRRLGAARRPSSCTRRRRRCRRPTIFVSQSGESGEIVELLKRRGSRRRQVRHDARSVEHARPHAAVPGRRGRIGGGVRRDAQPRRDAGAACGAARRARPAPIKRRSTACNAPSSRRSTMRSAHWPARRRSCSPAAASSGAWRRPAR